MKLIKAEKFVSKTDFSVIHVIYYDNYRGQKEYNIITIVIDELENNLY